MTVIIAVMVCRQNVVVPAVAATFLTAWAYTGNLASGLSSVFNASLTAASELFSIFLIIALITALLGSLRAMGADKRMVMPFQKTMRTGTVAFFVIFTVTYFISLFFWPTPAVPLIGAILLPAAIRAGLPAMAGAMAIAIAGQGMALSSDYVIQVAPGLSAAGAGVDTGTVADRALVLSLVTGLVAIAIVFLRIRSQIKKPDVALLTEWEQTVVSGEEVYVEERAVVTAGGGDDGSADVPASGGGGSSRSQDLGEAAGAPVKRAQFFAVLVPLVFIAVVAYMILGKFTDYVPETSGGDAAGLVGGTAAVLLLVATMTLDGRGCLETCSTHVVDGLVFAFKAMGVVIPIAGFFFIGNSDFAGRIMGLDEGEKAPGFLFDLVSSVQHLIPEAPLFMGLGLLLIGMATGLDGSGFSGLPLTGSLSGALGPASGVDPETLAAIGQMGAIWTGGGTLIAWSSLLAVAGFARVPVLELVRNLFLPVVAGLLTATVVAVIIF
ncbi:hypothetical protein [Aeromicrobium chenweiae]|uniref:Uncharacterized protein n=1 Tax=Aeromicrobium chenweiae TaxID=2079793 RepID=A0A2S0WPD8_9ACTN|nr:hypothetical protein [Aeromicrobium chenweiae]AWB93162.1 hypothetical protein C3E78_13655 [Aeromicrobium chenweiae]TGN34152.1 hypothetical protein E4L97_03690 [Aeromicrobium chenweiae]